MQMKLLHTSDWHLGRMLYSKKERNEEHGAFLLWLSDVIRENAIDVLLIAGDVFDSTAPGNASLKMYYDFLSGVRDCGCRHVVIVGGNHDSPSLLDAPKEILSALNVKVVGKACDNLDDEVFVLTTANGKLVVCAVPFLRERDIGKYTEGESYSDRSQRIAESIKKHYSLVAEIAQRKRSETGEDIPIVATGHLSVAGGKTTADDGVRETYIGSIECVGSDIFPPDFDYVALGHYHIPSRISDYIRYCGSPIPMGFGEAKQIKKLVIVDFKDDGKAISEISVPCFQKLESIVGDKETISERLQQLRACGESVWIEIVYTGNEIFADLATWATEQLVGSKVEILKVQNKQYLDRVLTQEDSAKSLEELNEYDVFDRLLAGKDFPTEQKSELKALYRETVSEINEKDRGA